MIEFLLSNTVRMILSIPDGAIVGIRRTRSFTPWFRFGLSGSNGPSGEHLVALLRSSDLIFERVLHLADRKRIANRHGLETLKDQFASLSGTIAAALA